MAMEKKRRDGRHEGPKESLPSMAAGMRRICGHACSVQSYGEKYLIDRVGDGVRSLGKHAGGSRSEPCNQLGSRDYNVGHESDHDGACALAACGSPESGG